MQLLVSFALPLLQRQLGKYTSSCTGAPKNYITRVWGLGSEKFAPRVRQCARAAGLIVLNALTEAFDGAKPELSVLIMGIPDEQIFPHATGNAQRCVHAREGASELVFHGSWCCLRALPCLCRCKFDRPPEVAHLSTISIVICLPSCGAKLFRLLPFDP